MSNLQSLRSIHMAIRSADSVEQLRTIRDRAHEQLELCRLSVRIAEWSDELNGIHDALIGRAIAIAERQTAADIGPLPCPYAFVLFGSGGRREQTLWSDQDNGLIYADEKVASGRYFARLAENIGQALGALGYPPCEGNVLAGNEQWRMPLTAWLELLDGWMDDPDWEHVRCLLIAADARCIHGDIGLTRRLGAHLDARLQRQPELLTAMLSNTLHHKVAVGLFGRLVTERYGDDAGGFDVKYGAYIPMVNALRLLACAHEVKETSSLARICGLREAGVLDAPTANVWAAAFESVLKLRSETAFRLEDGYHVSGGMLELDRARRMTLKHVLRVGRHMQRTVAEEIESITGKRRHGHK